MTKRRNDTRALAIVELEDNIAAIAGRTLELAPAEQAAVYVRIQSWQKAIEDLRATVRAHLMMLVDGKGSGNGEDTSRVYRVDGFELQIRGGNAGAPSPALVDALLAKRRIPRETVFAQRIEWDLDHKRLDALVAAGKLSTKEIDGCRGKPTTRSLFVQAIEKGPTR